MNKRKRFYVFSMLVIILLLYRSFPKIDILTWSFLLMNEAEADFLRNWCRVQQSQLDVDIQLGSCQTCAKLSVNCSVKPTAIKHGVSFWHDIRPVGDFSHIYIRTRNTEGQFKTQGGDTWLAYVQGPSFLTASVFDLHNGTYEVLFLPVLQGSYRIQISLMNTACNGLVQPSATASPPIGKLFYSVKIPKAKKEQLLHRLQYHMKFRDQFGPSILNYQRCCGFCGTCKHIWNGYGTWENETNKIKWRPYIKIDDKPKKMKYPKRVLRKNGTLWFFGDYHSQIFKSVYNRSLCGRIFKTCKNPSILYPKEDLRKLSAEDLSTIVLRHLRRILAHAQQLPDNALVLNAAFIGHLPYKHYTVIIDKIAEFLQDTFNDTNIPTQIVWSTMLPKPGSRYQIHYPLYNTYANWQMCNAKIPILDVFSLADSYPSFIFNNHTNLIGEHPFESVERLLEDYFERTAYK